MKPEPTVMVNLSFSLALILVVWACSTGHFFSSVFYTYLFLTIFVFHADNIPTGANVTFISAIANNTIVLQILDYNLSIIIDEGFISEEGPWLHPTPATFPFNQTVFAPTTSPQTLNKSFTFCMNHWQWVQYDPTLSVLFTGDPTSPQAGNPVEQAAVQGLAIAIAIPIAVLVAVGTMSLLCLYFPRLRPRFARSVHSSKRETDYIVGKSAESNYGTPQDHSPNDGSKWKSSSTPATTWDRQRTNIWTYSSIPIFRDFISIFLTPTTSTSTTLTRTFVTQ